MTSSMISPSFLAAFSEHIARTYPDLARQRLSKTQMLQAIQAQDGWKAVLQSGHQMRSIAPHPVIEALLAGQTPRHVLLRWMSLERFGHTHNRTTLLNEEEHEVHIRHYATDDAPIEAVNDLFIWGLLATLLDLAGFRVTAMALLQTDGTRHTLRDPNGFVTIDTLPDATHTVVMTCEERSDVAFVNLTDEEEANSPNDTYQDELGRLFRTDLLHPWTLSDAARASHTSPRTLQRILQKEGTTFSMLLQRTRVEHARSLLRDDRLMLTDIAFCTGFSDQAHFTRTFRKHMEVPPSTLRDLLRKSSLDARSSSTP